MPTTTN
jgi:hypothetical protein